MKLACVLCLVLAFPLLGSSAEVSEAEGKVLASRRSIHSGRLDILAVLIDAEGKPRLKNEYWVEFEGDKLRFDYFVSQKPDDTTGLSGFKRMNVRTSEGLLLHDDAEQSGINSAVTKRSPEELKNFGGNVLFDPRQMGLSAAESGALHAHNFEVFVGNADRKSTSVMGDDLDGRRTTRVEYLRTDGAQARIWIDPERGHCVVRAELESVYGSEIWLDRIDCELKEYDVDKVWFPEVIQYKRFTDGQLRFGETTTVRAAKFNFDIPDDRFTLATMSIPSGTPIADLEEGTGGTQMWNGERLVRMSNPDLVPSVLDPSENRSYWAAAVMFNLLVILGFWYYVFSRNRKRV